MSTLEPELLDALGKGDEVGIIAQLPDGTARPAVPVWVVRVEDATYVRSFKGEGGAWYRRISKGESGAITVGGEVFDVTFTPVPPSEAGLHAAIDNAYRAKYARYGPAYLEPILTKTARASTLRLDQVVA